MIHYCADCSNHICTLLGRCEKRASGTDDTPTLKLKELEKRGRTPKEADEQFRARREEEENERARFRVAQRLERKRTRLIR